MNKLKILYDYSSWQLTCYCKWDWDYHVWYWYTGNENKGHVPCHGSMAPRKHIFLSLISCTNLYNFNWWPPAYYTKSNWKQWSRFRCQKYFYHFYHPPGAVVTEQWTLSLNKDVSLDPYPFGFLGFCWVHWSIATQSKNGKINEIRQEERLLVVIEVKPVAVLYFVLLLRWWRVDPNNGDVTWYILVSCLTLSLSHHHL